MIAYKFLRPGGRSLFTGFRWELPDDEPGGWVDARVDPCRSGIHACLPAHLPLWAGRALYEIEHEDYRARGCAATAAASVARQSPCVYEQRPFAQANRITSVRPRTVVLMAAEESLRREGSTMQGRLGYASAIETVTLASARQAALAWLAFE